MINNNVSIRQTFALINLSIIAQNYLNIKNFIGIGKQVMPVIKADAYGHGMVKVARKLAELPDKPSYFGVALYEEAIQLRSNGFGNKILVFQPLSKPALNEVIKSNLLPTISEFWQLELFKSTPANQKIGVHLKLDSGMGRLGTDEKGIIKLAEEINSIPNIYIDGIYTHFATSDENDKSYALIQLDRFKYTLDQLKSKGIDYGIAHAANSGAIVNLPDSHFDMVRPGISLYGYYPNSGMEDKLSLQPGMSLESTVEQLKDFPANTSVSYGRTFVTKRNTRVATVPIGYADGIPRLLSNNFSVIINGKLYKQIGRVTMDRIMIDIEDGDVHIGDKVTLLGKNGNKGIDAWNWSEKIGTIPYEITCNVSGRVPRIYV